MNSEEKEVNPDGMDEDVMDGKTSIIFVHKENGRPITIYDVPYEIDDENDMVSNVEDAIREYNKGNWDYLDGENGNLNPDKVWGYARSLYIETDKDFRECVKMATDEIDEMGELIK